MNFSRVLQDPQKVVYCLSETSNINDIDNDDHEMKKSFE